MNVLKKIKARRLLPIMLAYLVTGIVAVEIVSQLVEVELIPEVSSRIVLVIYLFGAFSSLIYGWFHGEPGRQKSSTIEFCGHFVIVLAVLYAVSTLVQQENDLIGLSAGSGPDPRAIAVLYFEDTSSENILEDIANGMTSELIEQLSGIPELDVISENGIRQYRTNESTPSQVAQELAVGTVITGEVSENNNVLNFTTRLIDGVSGIPINRSMTEVPISEFLNNRLAVTESVADSLRQRLGDEIQLRESRESSSNFDSWILVQRANRLREEAEDNFDNGGDLEISIDQLDRADQNLIEAENLDPAWLDIGAIRANVAYRKAWFKAGDGDLAAAQADIIVGISIAESVLANEPRHAEALNQRGTLKMLALATGVSVGSYNDVPLSREIEDDLRSAVRFDPSLASAHSMLSFYYSGLNDDIETALSARRALEADAYLRDADRIFDRLIYAYYNLGELRESNEWCDEGYKRFPENPRFAECRLQLMASSLGEPDLELAFSLLEELQNRTPPSLRPYKTAVGQIMVAGVHRLLGLVDEAEEIYGAIESSERIDPQNQLSYYEAQIRAITGDIEGALRTLRRREAIIGDIAFDRDDLIWYWRNLEDHPDFQDYLSAAN